jgi:hypothetical protein
MRLINFGCLDFLPGGWLPGLHGPIKPEETALSPGKSERKGFCKAAAPNRWHTTNHAERRQNAPSFHLSGEMLRSGLIANADSTLIADAVGVSRTDRWHSGNRMHRHCQSTWLSQCRPLALRHRPPPRQSRRGVRSVAALVVPSLSSGSCWPRNLPP